MSVTRLRGDITSVKFYYPHDKKLSAKGEMFEPNTSSYSYSLWTAQEKKVKDLDKKLKKPLHSSVRPIVLPFDIDSFKAVEIDAGTMSLGLRMEQMNAGQCGEVYGMETWRCNNDQYKYINIFKAFDEIDVTGYDLAVIEHQINPEMFFVENLAIGIMNSKGLVCAVVESNLKSHIFNLAKGDLLEQNSIDKTVDILEHEGDEHTINELKRVKGDSRVGTKKTLSDFTDPALMTRALHVHMINYCLHIQVDADQITQ